MARRRQQVIRTPERYRWEKTRVRLPEAQRHRAGATERDTGLLTSDLEFHAEYAATPASQELAALFNAPVGTKLLHRAYRTRSRREGAPLGLVDSYLTYDLAAGNPALLDPRNEPWPGGTQHQLHTLGVELDRIVDQLTTRPPTRDEIASLGLAPGVPVFALRAISIDTADRVVEVSDVVGPGDRTAFEFTTQLPRWTR